MALMSAALQAPLTRQPWHLYWTLGVLVGGSVCLGYASQSLFLANWFVCRVPARPGAEHRLCRSWGRLDHHASRGCERVIDPRKVRTVAGRTHFSAA